MSQPICPRWPSTSDQQPPDSMQPRRSHHLPFKPGLLPSFALWPSLPSLTGFPETGSSLLFSLLSYILRITEVGVKEGDSYKQKQLELDTQLVTAHIPHLTGTLAWARPTPPSPQVETKATLMPFFQTPGCSPSQKMNPSIRTSAKGTLETI